MIIDAHLHCTGRETADDVLRMLDEAGVDIGVLLAPFLGDGYSLDDAASLRRGNAHLSRLVRGHPDRLIGLAVVDPRRPDAPEDLRHAIEQLGLRGAKMVPTGWYPYEARVQPVFAVADELGLPLLFHSGIFIDGRSGRFCRPSYFEALRDHPRTRVTLAHMGWPWTDEALAVALIDRIHGVPHAQAQFRLDISFGPPAPYRLEVLSRMLAVLGAGSLQFGSDCFLPCTGAHVRERLQWVADLMDEMSLPRDDRHQIWSGTAAAWLGIDVDATPIQVDAFAPVFPGVEPVAAQRAGFSALVSRASAGVDRSASDGDLWRPVCC
ncbi:amidohydrolase family protein [Mitsuaria sp. CC2]|uniref:amidohydrolase family protein n=1 Tax=Mitsuaria sp. CC2 TaxID=3029186 RepID=UPI003B8E7290